MSASRPSGFQRIERARSALTTDQVVSQIRDLISSGELQRGDRLPAERVLAERLGISRPSLRAGLRSLIATGILRVRHGSGTFIVEGPPALDSEPLKLLAALHGFTFHEMFEARRIIEETVAGLAAARRTEAQTDAIAAEIDAMATSLDEPLTYLVHDIRFHRAIGIASGNPILATLVEMVSSVMYQTRRETIQRAHGFSQSLANHRKIYRAIKARNPEKARAAMHQHLALAQRAYEAEEKAAARIARTRK
jgi:GntR family transcriptional regulator, transcriptional repressor for pyruvate dehydrogenase complex